MSGWQFWIDRGGTFTDIVGAPPGRRARHAQAAVGEPRALPRRRASPASASCWASRRASRSRPSAIDAVKMGTTVATNALLERKGEPHGAGHHPRLPRRAAHRLPEPAAHLRPPHRAARAALRAGGRGRRARRRARRRRARRSTKPQRGADLAAALRRRLSRRSRSCFMHGYRYPEHERSVGRARARASASRRSRSRTEVSPLMKLVGRGDTTVVDAYLSPILRRYVEQVAAELPGVRLYVHAVERRPDRRARASRARTRSCPGRPAASSARCAPSAAGRASTGSSASTWAAPRPTSRTTPASSSARSRPQVAGVRMRAPMMSIHTVAAGGGSILHFDGARFRVGPDSAGANPGPACYRRGGPLTVTDCQRDARQDPAGVLPAGVRRRTATSRSTREVVTAKFADARREIAARDRHARTPEQVAEGFLADRRRQHGERDQADLGAARPRRHASTRCAASAAPAASTPAWSPTRSA